MMELNSIMKLNKVLKVLNKGGRVVLPILGEIVMTEDNHIGNIVVINNNIEKVFELDIPINDFIDICQQIDNKQYMSICANLVLQELSEKER